jgi:asparagine synthase (glutamine-hydrolysing)
MGMRRLSIIDVAGGKQPISNEDGTIHVVCNGEIYNYRELRSELEGRRHHFSTRSDAEVIVHAYEEAGPGFVERLHGMFGFALWDARSETLVLGRDRLGIKPLYLARTAEWLLFGSEIKSLLQWPGLAPTVDTQALVSHVTRRFAVGRNSIFEGVERLDPGCILVRRRGHEELRRYWDLEARLEALTDQPPRTWEAYADELLTTLSESVESHLMSEVPLGAFLSGGLDSSSVVGLMTRLRQEPVKTYTVDFHGPQGYSEASHAAAVADAFSTDHRVLTCGPPSEELLRTIVHHLEEPIADPAVLPTFLVSQLAAEEVTVVMTGEGSDEANGGYHKYLASTPGGKGLTGPLDRVPATLRRWGLSRLARSRSALARRLERRLAWSLLSEDGFAIVDTELSWKIEALGLLEPELSPSGLGGGDAAAGPEGHFLSDLRGWLPNDLLLKVDRMTMAHSLEARVPYLDHRYVELALSVPWRMKLADGETKRVFREAMRNVLPREILGRSQHGFNVPLQGWFSGPLAPLLDDLLAGSRVEARGYFRPSAVEDVRRRAKAGDPSVTSVAWALLIAELWHQEFMDQTATPRVPEPMA